MSRGAAAPSPEAKPRPLRRQTARRGRARSADGPRRRREDDARTIRGARRDLPPEVNPRRRQRDRSPLRCDDEHGLFAFEDEDGVLRGGVVSPPEPDSPRSPFDFDGSVSPRASGFGRRDFDGRVTVAGDFDGRATFDGRAYRPPHPFGRPESPLPISRPASPPMVIADDDVSCCSREWGIERGPDAPAKPFRGKDWTLSPTEEGAHEDDDDIFDSLETLADHPGTLSLDPALDDVQVAL